MSERTFGIVKPDAVAAGAAGEVLAAAENGGLRIIGLRMVCMTRGQAEGFYYVHKERPFFGDLTAFMSEGPAVVFAMEGENAIAKWRQILGATNPEEAGEGSIRKRFGTNIERNAAHGSDGPDTASFEIGYFFTALDLVGA